MGATRLGLTADVLSVDSLTRTVLDSADGPVGAVATFVGLVRGENLGRKVAFLEYEAYEALALKAFARIDEEARAVVADDQPRPAPSHGPARDWRGEHRDRRGVGASRRGVRRVPLRHRARQADRADLEARALRRRRGLDRRRNRGSGRRNGARRRAEARMRVTVRLFARLREIVGAPELTRDVPDDATLGVVWDRLAARLPRARARIARRSPAPSTPITRACTHACTTATRSRFCHRCPAGRP